MQRKQEMRDELLSGLRVYVAVMYIVFASYLTLNYITLTSILPELSKSGIDVDNTYYSYLLFRASLISAVFTGLCAGKVGWGSIKIGFGNSLILLVLTYVLFKLMLV